MSKIKKKYNKQLKSIIENDIIYMTCTLKSVREWDNENDAEEIETETQS